MEHLKLSLLISSFVIPLILSLTIFSIARQDVSKRIMAFGLLNAFFVFLANYFYFQKMFAQYSYIHSLHIAAVLWLFPMIFLYVQSIVGKSIRKNLWHLLPGAIMGCISALLFYGLLNQQERVFYLSNYRTGIEFSALKLKVISIFRMVDVFFIVAQIVYYSIVLIRIPKKYNSVLMQEYSNIENFSINWLYWFNGAFVLVGILSILFYVVNPFHSDNELFLVFFLFVISAFIWIIGISSFTQKKPRQPEEAFIPDSKLVTDPHHTEEALVASLIKYFETDQPYLNPELSLTSVCKQVGTNRTYLSNIINSRFKMNFNAFVNQYRVKHILNYQKDYPSATYSVLMEVGGFGSVSSLKRALEKFGKTH